MSAILNHPTSEERPSPGLQTLDGKPVVQEEVAEQSRSSDPQTSIHKALVAHVSNLRRRLPLKGRSRGAQQPLAQTSGNSDCSIYPIFHRVIILLLHDTFTDCRMLRSNGVGVIGKVSLVAINVPTTGGRDSRSFDT